MLRLDDVDLSAGTLSLLRGASFHLHPGDRVGLVGRNGAGKTTLLRAIVGEADLDRGRVQIRSDVQLGYLPQEAVSGSERTVWDEARSRMTRFQALEADLVAARTAVEAHAPGADVRLADATEAWRLAGGYALDERIGAVLHGLGFSAEDWQRSCATFSGGWQMRIALARLLLSEPTVLLLDEPTNHLDLHARSWLAGFLAASSAAVVMVSHDRYLLDRVCTRIVEVHSGTLHSFTGNFSAWVSERALRRAQAESTYEAQQAEIARLERFVTRFKAKASKASQAQSKQKMIDRIERVEAPEVDRRPRLRLPDAPACSHDAITLRGASVGYGAAEILRGVDVTLTRGMRLAVLGVNGSGKSTLLHALSGRLPVKAGRRLLGQDVRVGLFTQDLAQELPEELSALDAVLAAAPGVPPQQARAALGALGLSGDAGLRPVGALSGGEKARVALARFAVRPANVLLLDEPTNHLDAVTVEVLVEALRSFEGALLLVSHDRWAVEMLATHVAIVHDGAVTVREGLRAEDFDVPGRAARAAAEAPAGDDHASRKRRQRELERVRRRVEAIGGEIEAAEARVAELETTLYEVAADHQRAMQVAAEHRAAEARVVALYDEWERLESELGQES